jgi:sRNA-binding regulator protein Hfq
LGSTTTASSQLIPCILLSNRKGNTTVNYHSISTICVALRLSLSGNEHGRQSTIRVL